MSWVEPQKSGGSSGGIYGGGGGGGGQSAERKQRNPKKELVRGLARYLKSSSNVGQSQLLMNAKPYLRGLTPQEVRSASASAEIPRDVENQLVDIVRSQRVSERALKEDPGLDLNPISQGVSLFGRMLREASRPGQAVVSGVAEYSRQAEQNPIQVGPVSLRLAPGKEGKTRFSDWAKIAQRAGEGFMLKRSDTPVTIATEAGRIRKKQGVSTKSFGFLPGTDLEKGQALPGGTAGKITYDIGGMIALDPLTYVTFGGGAVAKAGLMTTKRVLGAQRAAEVAEGGVRVLTAAEKAELGTQAVRQLRGLKPGVKVRVPQPIARMRREGKLLAPPRTVIPYGPAGRVITRGAQRARDLPLIRAVDTAFVPRAEIRAAERSGQALPGTAEEIDRLRVSFGATANATRDMQFLKSAARQTRLSPNEAREVAFALDEGARASLRTDAQRLAYDLLDSYRKRFSEELRSAGVLDTSEAVQQKRIDAIIRETKPELKKRVKALEKAEKKRYKLSGEWANVEGRKRVTQQELLEQAEATNFENALAREAELERRAVARVQGEVRREVLGEGLGAKRASEAAAKRLKDLQRRYDQVRKTLGARRIAESRAALDEAAGRITSLQRGIKEIETRIERLRNAQTRIRDQIARLGNKRKYGILTPDERTRIVGYRQRIEEIDGQVENLTDDLQASRNALDEATDAAAEAQRNFYRMSEQYGSAQVSKLFADTPVDELARLEQTLSDDVLRAMSEAEELGRAAERLAPMTQRALKSEPIAKRPLARMPGAPRPGITRELALQREAAAVKKTKLAGASEDVAKAERAVQKLRQQRAERVAAAKPGIEDEFYYPHVESIASKQRRAEEVDQNQQVIDLVSQPVKADRKRAKFTQSRKSEMSLREKVASDDAKYNMVETNPYAAFATHALEGRREIATRHLIRNLMDMSDASGRPLMESTDDYLAYLKESGLPELEDIDDITKIDSKVRDAILNRSGRVQLTIEKIGPNGENMTFLVPSYLESFVKKTAGLIGRGQMAGFLKGVDRWMSLWKSYATLPFPFGAGFSLRNGTGNVTLNWLADIKPTDKAYKEAAVLQNKLFRLRRAGKGFDEEALRAALSPQEYEIFNAAMEREIFGSGFQAVDLAEDPLFAFRSRKTQALRRLNPIAQENIALVVGRAFNSMIENNSRLAHFIAKSRELGDFDDAAASVRKYLFDYADLTPFEQSVMRRVMPFYTFMRKNTPLWLGAFFTDPVKYSRLEQWRKTMYDATGRPDMGVVPSYLEAGGAFPSPFELGGLPTMAGPDLPPGAASDVLTPILSLPGINRLGIIERRPGASQQSIQQLINMVGGGAPGFAKTLVELGLGRQAFTGRPFYPGEQVPTPAYLQAIGANEILGERIVEGEQGKAIPYELQYLLEQNLPILPKIGALFPQTEAGRDTQLRRILSMLTGAQLYPLGKPTRRTELFKRVQQVNALLDEIRSRGGTVPENLKRESGGGGIYGG